MVNPELLIDTLGGPTVFRCPPQSFEKFMAYIRRGIPFRSLHALAEHVELDINRIGTILMIPPRTLARRRISRKLAPDESDRVVRFARIVAYALEVFRDRHKASAWLQRPNRALRNMAPMDLLDTDFGTESVKTILGRIHHGVYS